MLSRDKIDKLVEQSKSIFIDENEGKHVALKTTHRAFRSGTLLFEFDIHVNEFKLTGENDNLTLYILMTCMNPTLKDIHWDREYPIDENPTLEYFEDLTNEQPGRFDITNKAEIIIDRTYLDSLRERNDEDGIEEFMKLNDYRLERIFSCYEDTMNEDSNYNINLSRIVHADTIEARQKLIAQAKAEEEALAKKQQRKEKFNDTMSKVKTGAAVTGIAGAAALAAPVIIPMAPVILLSGALAYFVSNLLDDTF